MEGYAEDFGASSGEDRAGGPADPSPAVSAKGAHPSRVQCETMVPDEEGWSEWIHPLPGYLMQCCDCDLIHEMEFAIGTADGDGPLNEGEAREALILFRARRHSPEPTNGLGPNPSREELEAYVADLERVLRPFLEHWCVEGWKSNAEAIWHQGGKRGESGAPACISISTVYGHVLDARKVLERGLLNHVPCPTCGRSDT